MLNSTRSGLRRHATRAIAGGLAVCLIGSGVAYAANGIDVSRWQHSSPIKWTRVKADGVSFTFMKATEKANYVNPYLAGDWARTKAVGIYSGVYHFARPSRGSAAHQARYFVNRARANGVTFKGRGDLPPVLDLEATGGLGVKRLRTWTHAWLRTTSRLTGRTPMIYTSPSFWEGNLGNSRAFTSYPLWIAHYTTGRPRVPGGWTHWTFWQRSSTGRVTGISGAVDMDRFNGSLAQLKTFANVRPAPGDPTTPPGPGTTPDPAAVTTVSLSLSRDAVFRGRTVEISGDLTTPDGPVAGEHVVLARRASGSATWTRIASPATDATGHYSLSLPATGSADFRAAYRGDLTHAPSRSALSTLTMRAKTATRATLDVDPASRQGRTVKIYGHLRTVSGRPLAGRTMDVYQRLAGSTTWRLVGHGRTIEPTGWYQAWVTPTRTATYKAVFGGGATLRRSVSNLTTVRVR